MYTLAIDTSNQHMGIAIMKETEPIGEQILHSKKNHSVQLMPAIDQLMKKANIQPDNLQKIVVAHGPGSYTGVRIGITTAKTMAWALNIPVVGVSSLKTLAYQGKLSNLLICPFFDARRGLVYSGLYEVTNEGLHEVEKERNSLMSEWLEYLASYNKKILFLSPDIKIHEEDIQKYLKELAIIPQEMAHHISRPAHLALIGQDQEEKDLHHLVPNYLRLAEAEVNWLNRKKETN